MGKVYIVGMDALSMPWVLRFVEEGALPHFQTLVQRGARSEALSVIPPYTPTNWATIASGAIPGRHGAGNWWDVSNTDPLSRVPVSTFHGDTLNAEPLWAAAARQGKRTLTITYPGAYPAREGVPIVIGPLPRGLVSLAAVRGEERTLTLAVGGEASWRAEFKPKEEGFAQVRPTEDGAGEGVIGRSHSDVRLEIAVTRSGVDKVRVTIATGSGSPQSLRELQGIGLGPWETVEFMQDGRRHRGSIRFGILATSTNTVRLLRSELYPLDTFTEPEGLGPALVERLGPFIENPSIVNTRDQVGLDAVLTEVEQQVAWYVGAAREAAHLQPYDLFMCHWHWVDTAQHAFLAYADPPVPGFATPAQHEQALDVMRRSYQMADRLLGGFLDLCGPEDHVVVVSDHGNVPNRYVCSVPRRLQAAGLLQFRPGTDIVDRTQSLVYPLGPHQITVNLAGRNAGGMVPPEEYQSVVARTIEALETWRTPEGQRVVSFALDSAQSQVMGYFGPRTGDVMFLFDHGCAWGTPPDGAIMGGPDGGSNHGAHMPTAKTANSSNLAVFMAMGPGVRPGYQRDPAVLGYTSLTDVAPLAAHWLGIEAPRDCRGNVPRDFLTHH